METELEQSQNRTEERSTGDGIYQLWLTQHE